MHLGEINPDSCSISLKWSLQQLAASVNLVPCVKNVLNVAWTVFMISAPTSLIKSHVVNLEPDWGLCCCSATHWCLPLCLSVTIFYLIRHSFHRYETVIFTSALTARFHRARLCDVEASMLFWSVHAGAFQKRNILSARLCWLAQIPKLKDICLHLYKTEKRCKYSQLSK